MGSITQHIRNLESGERRDGAARDLWDRYFEELVRHALKTLRAVRAPRRIADEEDAALHAFFKVCQGIERGQLNVGNRDDLRKLLLWSAKCEAINQANHAFREGLGGAASDGDDAGIQRVPGKEMTPESLLLVEEGCRRLLDLLGEDRDLRRIALCKLLGHTNEEIAKDLSCCHATVERKIDRIRMVWDKVAPDGPPKPGPRNTSGADVAKDLVDTTTILRGLSGQP
jgi:DNA-directed RNA polymerase specialized sigma24 family protein